MLKLDKINKIYGKDELIVNALKDVSLEFEKGEFVSILGPSGCGKTTMLNIIGGLDKYSTGDLQIDGVSTREFSERDWDEYRNHHIGFVFQNYYLIPHQNVLDNVELAMTLSGISAAERKARALKALEQVGLASQVKKMPNQLSSGQCQRVAIARAIATNPSIILADEPTGALDGENSVQIMELLREVAGDKLIIMVTHNPELAYAYSTRIVKIRDGEIVGDEHLEGNRTPVCTAENAILAEETAEIATTTPAVTETPTSNEPCAETAQNAPAAMPDTLSKTEDKNDKKNKKRNSMSLGSSFKLSVKNLISKKGRTALTTVASSIGIICVALVLAINSGFNAYIQNFEKDSLSKYPIVVDSGESSFLDTFRKIADDGSFDNVESINMNDILGVLEDDSSARKAYTDEQKIFIKAVITAMMDNADKLFKSGDISNFKNYLENNLDYSKASVKYDYNINPNIYMDVSEQDEDPTYKCLNPMGDNLFGSITSVPADMDAETLEQAKNIFSTIKVWDMMIDDYSIINEEYDVYGHLPGDGENEKYTEVVLVLDKYNQLTDTDLLGLGNLDFLDIVSSLLGDNDLLNTTYDFSEMIGREFKLILNTDKYSLDAETNRYVDISTDKPALNAAIAEKGITLKISGILREKEGGGGGSINGAIGFTQDLVTRIINNTNSSAMVLAQHAQFAIYASQIAADPECGATITNVSTGNEMTYSEYTNFISKLGVKDINKPTLINIYPKSIEAKNYVLGFIDSFNTEAYDNYKNDDTVLIDYSVDYTDNLSAMVSSLEKMVGIITSILIAVTAIALVVSLLMIGILMYTSVQDRTKEIGILRSIGASKSDVVQIFNTETTVLGLIAGAAGVFIAFILKFPLNLIISKELNISGLIQPIWWQYILVIFGAVILTIISGLIPAFVAAKKNPVNALRTE